MSRYRILISGDAEADLDETIEWYSDRQAGLGFDFAVRVEEALEHLEQNPLQYQLLDRENRMVQTKQFPFSIFYWVDEEKREVNVFAIVHQSQPPGFWQKRTR